VAFASRSSSAKPWTATAMRAASDVVGALVEIEQREP
jgi:hypothetical protein